MTDCIRVRRQTATLAPRTQSALGSGHFPLRLGGFVNSLSVVVFSLFATFAAVEAFHSMQHLRAVTSSAVDALRPVQRFRAAVSAPKASSAAPHKRPKRLPCFAEVLDRAWPGVTGTYKDIFDITSVQQFKSHDVYKTTVKGKKKQGIHPFPKAHWYDHLALEVKVASKPECAYLNDVRAIDGEFLQVQGVPHTEYVDCHGHGSVPVTTRKISVDEFLKDPQYRTVEFCKDDPPPMSQMHDGSTQTQTRRFHDQSTQTDKTSLPRNSRKNFAGYFRRLKSARPARHAEPSSNKKQRASLHPDEAPASTVFAKMKAKKSSRQATASPGPFSEAQPTTSMQPAKPLTAVELKKKAKPVRPPLYASPEERFAVMRQTRPPRPAHPPATVKFDKMRPKGQALPAGLPQRPPRPLRKPTKSGVTKLTDFFTSEQEKKKEQATAAQELRGYLARIKKMKPTKMATKLLPNGQRHSWEHLF